MDGRPLPEALLRPLERFARALLGMDPERAAALQSIAGKAIAIEFRGIQARLVVLPRQDGLHLAVSHDGPVHVTVHGAPFDMLGYLAGAAPAAGRGLDISGDVAVAEKLQEILRGLDPDWEEALSGWVGDAAARRLGNALRGAGNWARGAGRSTLFDLDEYLRFETRSVPERGEVGQFVAAVDRLRDDVERLRARLNRLGRAGAGER